MQILCLVPTMPLNGPIERRCLPDSHSFHHTRTPIYTIAPALYQPETKSFFAERLAPMPRVLNADRGIMRVATENSQPSMKWTIESRHRYFEIATAAEECCDVPLKQRWYQKQWKEERKGL